MSSKIENSYIDISQSKNVADMYFLWAKVLKQVFLATKKLFLI